MQTMLTPDPLESRSYFARDTTTDTTPLTTTRVATIGDKVRFVLDEGRNRCQIRPATVVRTWSTQPGHIPPSTTVNLQVDIDGSNDFPASSIAALTGRIWRTSVPYSATCEPGTWHFAEDTEQTTRSQTIIDTTLL